MGTVRSLRARLDQIRKTYYYNFAEPQEQEKESDFPEDYKHISKNDAQKRIEIVSYI